MLIMIDIQAGPGADDGPSAIPYSLRRRSTTIRRIDLCVDGTVHRIGSSSQEPLTLTTSRFEYLRLALGRRSLGQIARLDWSSDPGRAAAALVSFVPSEVDIIDPVL